MDNQNKSGLPGTESELNQKQIFTDIHSSPAPMLVENYNDLPEPDFDKKTILDEAYAEQKAKREMHTVRLPKGLTDKLSQISHPKPQPHKKPYAKAQRTRATRFSDIRLCSGERPSDAARRIVREFAALVLFCVVVAAVFGIRGFVIDRMTNDDYGSLARSTTYSTIVSVNDMNWVGTNLPDGLAAAQTVCTALSAPITESTYTNKQTDKLLYPTVVSAGMASALTPERVQLKTNMSNLDLLLQIHMSLETEKPVIVLFFDKQTAAVRYGIVTHMDAEGDIITVQSADGQVHTFTFERFIAATRFEHADKLPFQVRAGLLFGSWGRNTAIFVK